MSSSQEPPLRELLDRVDDLLDYATRCQRQRQDLEEENEQLREQVDELQQQVNTLQDQLQDQRMEFADVMGRLEHRLKTIRDRAGDLQ